MHQVAAELAVVQGLRLPRHDLPRQDFLTTFGAAPLIFAHWLNRGRRGLDWPPEEEGRAEE
jgi:hypothetical protein